MPADETIAALATPPGEAALAIIRLSGSDLTPVYQALGWNGTKRPAPRTFQRAIYHGVNGDLLDDLTFIPFQAPRSFTGEDMIELITHGSPFIVEKILHDLQLRGVRLADPGEFSRTAFLHGKFDLTQAEAIVDLIRARSDRALLAAQKQLSGALGKTMEAFVRQLLVATAHLEAYIDFPEEDLPPEDHQGPIQELDDLIRSLESLAATQKYRERLQDGIQIVILGEPNAGKSTLLNALAGEERAIVSPEAGTTRDYIEARAMIGSHLVRLTDTAGLRTTESAVEQAGVERSRRLAASADLILLVVDRSQPPPALDDTIQAALDHSPTLLILNKADLALNPGYEAYLPTLPRQSLCASTGEGLPDLLQNLKKLLNTSYTVPASADVIVSARHAGSLQTARDHILQAREHLSVGAPPELAASDLHLAIEALGLITGKIDNERMLDELFGSFCIGK